MIVTCHCFFHPAKKLRSGAIVRFSDNSSSFNFLMGDNSVDMIPPALDNGEPNSTMANQIAYSPKETILEAHFCTQMVPSSCETKWCPIIQC